MAYYRLYFMDGVSSRISDFEEFEAIDDAAAAAVAENRRRRAAMELWCRARKVKRWEPITVGSAPKLRSVRAAG